MKTKISYCLTLALISFVGVQLAAANLPPELKGVTASFKKSKKLLTVRYDIADPENDSLTVSIALYDNTGRQVPLHAVTIRGDMGFPVFRGKGKSITIEWKDPLISVQAYTARLIATDHRTPDLAVLAVEIDSVRIRKDIEFLARERNRYSQEAAAHLARVQEKLLNDFRTCGAIAAKQPFQLGDSITGINVKAQLPGLGQPGELIVVGAHIDGVKGSPGADDNASGTAVLLEVARVLSKYGFDKSLEFVGFDMEEVQEGVPGHPAYNGSRKYVQEIMTGQDQKVAGFINLDMVGYFSAKPGSQALPEELKYVFPAVYDQVLANQKRGDFLLVISNQRSKNLSDALLGVNKIFLPSFKAHVAVVPGNGENMDDFRRADHVSFWDKGYTAISLGDGAYSRNPHYHSKDDLISDIDYAGVTNVARLVLLTLADLAKIKSAARATATVTIN